MIYGSLAPALFIPDVEPTVLESFPPLPMVPPRTHTHSSTHNRTSISFSPTSMRAALLRYRATVSILKKGYQQENYRIDQLLRTPLANKRVDEVTSVDIAAYRDARLSDISPRSGKAVSPATVRLELSLLSSLFDIARIEWGYTDKPNPCKDVRKPAIPPGRERRLRAREERRILCYAYNHVNPELYSIIVLALSTAMRQGEILSIAWENVDFRSRVIHLPNTKNGSKRNVPLTNQAKEALVRLGVRPSGKVFTYTSCGIKSTWRFMLNRLGIEDLHFHDMRHEAISRLFELGTLDMMEIAEISGHKSIAMLKRYTHLRASRLVHKMEGSRGRVRAAVLSSLIPYPGVMTEPSRGMVSVAFPDFEFPVVTRPAANSDDAQILAQDLLLRTLIDMMREGKRPPPPDHYLDCPHKGPVIMIDPMATT